MKNTIITCKSEEEMEKVLKKLDKTEVRWASGNMPSEHRYWDSSDKLYITFDKIRTYRDEVADYAHVTGDDFLRNRDGKIPPIVIYFKGNETIALDKETGKKGVARCHPSDEFDRISGAIIALTRLAHECGKKVLDDVDKHDEEKTSEPKFKVGDKVKIKKGLERLKKYGRYMYVDAMDSQKDSVLTVIKVMKDLDGTYSYNCKGENSLYSFWYSDEMIDLYEEPVKKEFKVGDRVRIREWDDMAKEFGHTATKINCKFGFIYGMIQYCGKIATIKTIHDDAFKLVFDDESSYSPYIFSTDMIEPAEEKNDTPKFNVGDYVTLADEVEANKRYGGIKLLDDMYSGAKNKKMTIRTTNNSSEGFYYLCRQCDGGSMFYYSEVMLKPYEKKEAEQHEFKVGDVVRVIQWEDMKEEFRRIDTFGGIMCQARFVDGVRKLCGKKAVITDIDGNLIDLDFIDDVVGYRHWEFSINMVEKVNDDEESVKEPDIKEGDRIVVTDDGKLYTTYSQWVETQDLPEYQKYGYDYGHSVANGTIGRVIKIAEHGNLGADEELLVYFKAERMNRYYLIGIDGVKKVEE